MELMSIRYKFLEDYFDRGIGINRRVKWGVLLEI